MAAAKKKARRAYTRSAKPGLNGEQQVQAEHAVLIKRAQELLGELGLVVDRLREIRTETSISIDSSVDSINRILSGQPMASAQVAMAKPGMHY